MVKANAGWSLIFVNDGSSDNTIDCLLKIKSAIPTQVSIIELQKNCGKGEAVRQGALYAVQCNFNYIAYLDADLATDQNEFTRLAKLIHPTRPIIIGSRIKKADTKIIRSAFRHFIGRGIATLVDLKYKLGVYDTQCGAKIFNASILKDTIEKPFYTAWLFDVEILLRIRAGNKDLALHEEPLKIWKDDGNSKLNLLSMPLICKELFLLFIKY